ncbi:MAG TPA: hypothetical protein IGS53_07755 [Leptolyngbyaceae cyanobacterium M33_DOE_097]|uniref:DUF2808 domain-containing protein n=1 Tax=Oscillatoriales cyanobacterium SpSt-418 TaxID=2282169 RepID=A0A7C3PP35_9CYAN|nr:hypothetical protein [Leptolyngbyaceae cyanobacterium M33_DOE_097]
MQGSIYKAIPALLVAIASTSIVSSVSASPDNTSRTKVALPPIMAGETGMTFNFTAPFITSSGVRGDSHFIRVAVVGMSINDLMISLPKQMEKYEGIQVINQGGQAVPARISTDRGRVAIVFNESVTQGSYLEVRFTNVQMRRGGGETLFYGVTAERTGVNGEIPIGTARVNIPTRS